MDYRFESAAAVRDALRKVDYLSDEGIAGIVYLADRLRQADPGRGPGRHRQDPAGQVGGRDDRAPGSSASSATRASTSPRRSTSGTTRSSSCASRPSATTRRHVGGDRGRHLLRRVPAHPAAARGDPRRRPGRAAHRRGRPGRGRDRGAAARDPLRLPGVDPRAGHDRRPRQIPLVFLTSNNTRELSEALKRRCLFLHIDYPDMEREKEIVLTKVPDITESLADQVARIVRSIRQLELKKAPSVSETLDWARTLMLLGVEHDRRGRGRRDPANILLKYQTDIAKAVKEFSRRPQRRAQAGRAPHMSPTPAEPGGSPAGNGSDDVARAGPGAAAVAESPLLDLLGGFIGELREAGLPVSLTENLDAMEAVQAHPARGPRGVQVRAGRHAGEEQRPLAGLRDRLRGLLLAPGQEYALGDDAERRRPPEDDDEASMQGEDGRRRVRWRGRRQPLARGAGRDALPGAAAGRRGADAGPRPPGGQALRGHGAGPAGRRHLLPVPHAAEPRSRRHARGADGAGPRGRARAAHPARGAARARRVREPHRPAEEGDRGRDPPPPGGRPRRRGHGQDAAQAAARGRRLHARQPRGDGVAAQGHLSR